jgi:hypothetical protein
MKLDVESIYKLLPAIYRIRDAEQAEALKSLLAVIAEQVAVIEEDLAQLYDDQFIETCAPWAVSYIGDLIGYRTLHRIPGKTASTRAEVANTIGSRRRKCTAVMLEQLARDVTGWHARVVEFFQRLATTQYMNHIRPDNIVTPDLRQWEPLVRIGTAFDSLAHTVDVRRIEPGRGRYNIPNVGVFLWRLDSYPLTDAQPHQLDARRFFFSPLGNDSLLFTLPEPQEEFSGLATRMNVPDPISRRALHSDLTEKSYRLLDPERSDYYGPGRSILIKVGEKPVEEAQIVACDLSDMEGGEWAHQPEEKIAIDPMLGRIAFPRNKPAPQDVRVSFHYGCSADIGGGEYDRSDSVPGTFVRKTPPEPSEKIIWQIGVSSRIPPLPNTIVPTLAEAVQAWNQQSESAIGVISIMDSASYNADLSDSDTILVPAGKELLIIAADWPEMGDPSEPKVRVPGRFNPKGCRPHLRGKIKVRGIGSAGADGRPGRIFFNGLLVEGALQVEDGPFEEVSLRHCTLVPGRSLTPGNFPQCPRDASLTIAVGGARLELRNTITGGLRVSENVLSEIAGTIVDSTSRCGVAFSALDEHRPGGRLRIENSTVIGKVHTALMELASNSIFCSRLAIFDAWPAPVWCERRQSGCVRFSFVPLNALTPRRYRCQPRSEEEAIRVTPQFNSVCYGEPGYMQLSRRCAQEIATGADDDSEMGAFHDVFEPQRITNLRTRLNEYLRFGLEAGIFFEPHIVSRGAAGVVYGYGVPAVDLCAPEGAEQLPGIGGGLI